MDERLMQDLTEELTKTRCCCGLEIRSMRGKTGIGWVHKQPLWQVLVRAQRRRLAPSHSVRPGSMNVADLIRRLEDQDPEAEVRFNYQENYPLQDEIRGVWTPDADAVECEICGTEQAIHGGINDGNPAGDEDHEFEAPKRSGAGIVYIVSAGQVYDSPYGRAAFEGAY